MKLAKDFWKGIWKENPVLVQVLGMCPTLAVTTTLVYGFGMGIATLFVLFFSNLIVSLIRNLVPNKVRIPSFIVIIATFVTIADLVMKAYLPALSKALGIFVPLIVVNCIVLGRAEAFAKREPVINSLADAVGMGAGFTLALCVLGFVRELIGTGAVVIAGKTLFSTGMAFSAMVFAPGAFLTLGLLLGLFNHITKRKGIS